MSLTSRETCFRGKWKSVLLDLVICHHFDNIYDALAAVSPKITSHIFVEF